MEFEMYNTSMDTISTSVFTRYTKLENSDRTNFKKQAIQCFSNSPDMKVHFHGGIWHGKKGLIGRVLS